MIEIVRASCVQPESLRTRQQALSESADRAAREIIERVSAEGDRAVLELTERFDGGSTTEDLWMYLGDTAGGWEGGLFAPSTMTMSFSGKSAAIVSLFGAAAGSSIRRPSFPQ